MWKLTKLISPTNVLKCERKQKFTIISYDQKQHMYFAGLNNLNSALATRN